MKKILTVSGRACVLAFSTLIITTTHAESDYTVTESGPDYKVLEKTTVENGTNCVHRYTELATGMNYTNASGQLTESREQITLLPSGGAAATQGRHKVYFPGNIYNGVIEVVTPDGRHLQSRPLGVSYDDGSNTVFIATLKSAQGYLTSSNQVTYRDAFTGFKADLVCTYRRGGFECDLVFRQQPPTPGDFGLDDSFATLQLVTEFFNTQDPQQIPAQSDDWFGLQDSTLKFGKLTMTHGKAFAFKGTNSTAANINSAVPVYKNWLHSGGRTFLIESVPVLDIADNLDALPLTASISKPATSNLKLAANQREFPPSHELTACTNQIQLASADFSHEPGVVLDYNTVDDYVNDYTFQNGTTYYINGYLGVNNLTIRSGAIIKFSKNGSGIYNDEADSTISCATSPDKPAIFTAVDDDSVGEIITGVSTGMPDGYYADSALSMSYLDTGTIHDLRFYHLGAALGFNGCGRILLQNLEFHDCSGAINFGEAAIGPKLNNMLVENCGSLLECGTGLMGGKITHVTATNLWGGYLVNAQYYFWSDAIFKNCLLQGGLKLTEEYYNPDIDANESIDSSGSSNNGYYAYYRGFTLTNAAPFESANRAQFYLKANSPYRNAGTDSIDSTALADIQAMTTYAPQAGGFPDTNAPDLGYHYPVNEDSDHDGLPDWWEWHWFGSYAFACTNLDSSGNTLLSDYQNNLDPNVIQFSVETASNYVTNSHPALHLDVASGLPALCSVQVDNTNYSATTNWTAYTADLTASLGNQQGWHTVWVSLKGPAAEATVTWEAKRLKFDTVPPGVVITSPATGTVTQPMIQMLGYTPEALAYITYDLTNALGGVTNQSAFVSKQFYDTNVLEVTTNFFQAFDVPLTNGLNTLTLRATDLAGNVMVTNFSYTLDFTGKTNAPVVQLTWPQDGMQICSRTVTLRGQVDDFTATVTALVMAANGVTNVVDGLVERDGRFWLEQLPLNGGTNRVSITVRDAAGNVTVTNMNLTTNAMTLTLDPVNGDLWETTVAVAGQISDPTAAVWVNGVPGENHGDGTWDATNAPVTPGGVACFAVTAYAPGSGPQWQCRW